MGASKMTHEHLAVATALEIPVFVVVTKVDICPENVLRHTVKQLFKMLKSRTCNKMPRIMKRTKDVMAVLDADSRLQRFCPVFLVSSVTGLNIDRLYSFLSMIRPTSSWDPDVHSIKGMDVPLREDIDTDGRIVFEIDETFSVRGVGIVVSGTVTSGCMSVSESVVIGPFSDGSFKHVIIRSIHAKRIPVEDAVAGESCSVSIRFKNAREKLDRAHIRRGMILVDEEHVPRPARRFKAQVLVLHHPTTIKVAVIGNVDSGKSTMIGILTSGKLDDGRGEARSRIFRHNHERENGRTSCASQHIMGFDATLKAVHQPISTSSSAKQKTRAWQAVVNQSRSVVTFIDLAGHEKYLKTTISGLTGCFPDYAMILCGANMGASKMTHEHLAVATALEIPVFVVVTKVDICPENVLRHTVKQLFKMLKSRTCNKMPRIMKRTKDVMAVLDADSR
eukprot:77327_1